MDGFCFSCTGQVRALDTRLREYLRLTAAGWRVVRIPAELALGADHLLATVRKEVGLPVD